MKRAGFPEDTRTPERRDALGDLIARRFWESARTHARSPIPKADGGVVYMPRPGQEILRRGSVEVTEFYVEARFTADLPSKANKVDEMAAIDLIFGRISLIVSESMLFQSYNARKLYTHLETAENADSIRAALRERGLAAFVACGSVLPRREDGLAPMIDAVPFDCDDSLKVMMEVPNGEPIVGMGVPTGYTAVTGAVGSGKSTLAAAVFAGICDHIPGDGREYVVSDPDAVYVMAEPGRPCGDRRLSGPESEIAAIDEAVEAGSRLIILDEEYSSPCVVRRAFMSEGDSPSLSERGHAMGEAGVSLLIVTGDESAVRRADTVLLADGFRVRPVDPERLPSDGSAPSPETRYPVAKNVSFEKSRKEVSTSAPSVRTVEIGEYKVHVPVAGFFDQAQTREAADAIAAARDRMDGAAALREVCERALEKVESDDSAEGSGMAHARARAVDVAAVLSRHPQMLFITRSRGSAPVVPVAVLPVVEDLVGVLRHVDLVDLAVLGDDEPLDGVLLVAEGAADVRAVGPRLGARLAGDGPGLEQAELVAAAGAEEAPGGDLQILRDPGGPLLGGQPHGGARREGRVVGRALVVVVAHASPPLAALTTALSFSQSSHCSRRVPVTMMSAPASCAAAAASGVRMPPPMMSGMSIADLIARIISGGTGLSAPDPASK